jgi:uncharacterized protein (TIGR03083 family)
VPSDAPVPSCPDWTVDDLLWHLAEVQWFWGEVVRTRASGPDAAQAAKPARPADRAGLERFFARASADLLDELAADPATPVWTWAQDHSVGFVRRRQAHEALIHRVDAELAAAAALGHARTAIDPGLATDGVDEALRIMFGAPADWGTFTATTATATATAEDAGRPGAVQVTAVDTGRSWRATPGTFSGTSPSGDWTATEEPALTVADDSLPEEEDGTGGSSTGSSGGPVPVVATIAGTAADLDCMLWGRPPLGPVERFGDEHVLSAFTAVVTRAIS